jgi:hypothetical protein
VGRPIVTEPSGDGEMMARVELETTWPSDIIEEVVAHRKNTKNTSTMETDIPISNCNADGGDGDDGTSEGSNTLPSDAKATSESIIGVSFSHSNICI